MTKKTETKTEDNPITNLDNGLIKITLGTKLDTPNGAFTSLTIRRPSAGDIRRARRKCREMNLSVEDDIDYFLLPYVLQETLVPEDIDLLDGYDLLNVTKALGQSMGKPTSPTTSKK